MNAIRNARRWILRSPQLLIGLCAFVAPALGIAIATFAVVDGMVYRRLPYPEAHRLFALRSVDRRTGIPEVGLLRDDVRQLRRFRGFDALTEFGEPSGSAVLTGPLRSAEVRTAEVDEGFFTLFGPPLAGRPISANDIEPSGRVSAVILTFDIARLLFGDAGVAVGQAVRTERGQVTVVGVLSPHFLFPSATDGSPQLLMPMRPQRSPAVTGVRTLVVGRVATGLTSDELTRGLAVFDNGEIGSVVKAVTVVDLGEAIFGQYRPLLRVVTVAASLVAAGAAILFGMLLALAVSERRQEIITKTALGASFAQLASELIAVCVIVIGLAGGAAFTGWAVAGDALRQWLPGDAFQRTVAGPSLRLAVFALALVLIAAIVAVGVPLLQLRKSLWSSSDNARSAYAFTSRGGHWLLGTQMAIAVILTVLATGVVRAYTALSRMPLGFDPAQTLVLDIRLPREGFPTSRDRLRQQFEILHRVRMLPGVLSAGASTGIPMAGTLPESTMKEGSSLPGAVVWRATPGFVSSLGARVIAGSDLSGPDMEAVPSAILSESFSKAAFPGKSPVGSLVELGTGRGSVRVAGVIADVRHSLDSVPLPTVFVSFRSLDDPAPSFKVLVRVASRDRDAVSARIGAGLQGAHPLASIVVHPFAARLDRYLNYPRAQALLTMSLASTVLMFAGAGVYSLARGHLMRRRREFAIQLALGSTQQILRRAVWGSVRTPVLGGAALGMVVAGVANGAFVTAFGQPAAVGLGTMALALCGVLLPLVLVAYSLVRDVGRIDPVQLLK